MDTHKQIGRDMDGKPLYDGDQVLSFTLMAGGERYPLTAPKQGVPATIHFRAGQCHVMRIGGLGETGCRFPDDKQFGVRKIQGAN